MKKLVISLSLLLVAVMTAWGVASIGKSVQFPDGSFLGAAYKPNFFFATASNDSLNIEFSVLCLRMVSPTDYKAFDERSRILIRFADSTTITLHRAPRTEVIKNYTSSYIQNYGVAHYYSTVTQYEIDEDDIEKITTNPIIKIRVVINNNGVAEDFIIKPKYGVKLMQGLAESYKETKVENKQREKVNSDEDF